MNFAKSVLTEVDQMGCFEDPFGLSEKNYTMQHEKKAENGTVAVDLDDEAIVTQNSLMRKIGDEIFLTGRFQTRLDLKPLNVLDVSELNIVLVSSYQDLIGLPYLIRDRGHHAKEFKGRIIMTQALAQIGRTILHEFVRVTQDRDINAVNLTGAADT